jgi:hypothetical protein
VAVLCPIARPCPHFFKEQFFSQRRNFIEFFCKSEQRFHDILIVLSGQYHLRTSANIEATKRETSFSYFPDTVIEIPKDLNQRDLLATKNRILVLQT